MAIVHVLRWLRVAYGCQKGAEAVFTPDTLCRYRVAGIKDRQRAERLLSELAQHGKIEPLEPTSAAALRLSLPAYTLPPKTRGGIE